MEHKKIREKKKGRKEVAMCDTHSRLHRVVHNLVEFFFFFFNWVAICHAHCGKLTTVARSTYDTVELNMLQFISLRQHFLQENFHFLRLMCVFLSSLLLLFQCFSVLLLLLLLSNVTVCWLDALKKNWLIHWIRAHLVSEDVDGDRN